MGGTNIPIHHIDQFWRIPIISEVLHMNQNECCYACGKEEHLERAHILAKAQKGSNYASNFHVLCRLCHSESEYLDGADYWIWLCLKSHFYERGSLVPLEEEVLENKKVFLPYESELQTKFKENSLLFARLMLFRDNYIPSYERIWEKIEKTKSELLDDEEVMLSLPKTRLDFIQIFCEAMLGNLYEKYSKAIDLGIAASEHAQKFLKGEL